MSRSPEPLPAKEATLPPTSPPATTSTPTPEPKPVSTSSPAAPKSISFAADVAPILARCQPCHFPGGKMYDKLPFDRPETVYDLGTKLFTRIRSEEEQQVVRAFLAQAH